MFVDVSHLLPANGPALCYGAAVVEPFAPGERLILVAGFLGPNRLIGFEGGRFVERADLTLADPARQAIGVAGADVDGDGLEELYLVHADTYSGKKRLPDRLFDHGPGGFEDLFEAPGSEGEANQVAGRSAACIDRRGDGRYGFLVANHGGPLKLYETRADGLPRDVADEAGLARSGHGRALLSLPLVSKRMDVLLGNENGPNALFRNQGDGTFRDVAAVAGLADPRGHARGMCTFDAGGAFGLVVGNWEGALRFFLPDVPGVHFRTPGAGRAPAAGRVRTVIAADFDNDGQEELFVHRLGQPNLMLRRGERGWTRVPLGPAEEAGGFGTGAAVGDFDGDGCLELLLCHGEQAPQPLSLFRWADPGRRWLRIAPRTPFGAPARGARVRLVTDRAPRLRAICAGSGYLCQMEAVAHFGLAAGERALLVEVCWPDGTRALLPDPPECRELLVPHPGTRGRFSG